METFPTCNTPSTGCLGATLLASLLPLGQDVLDHRLQFRGMGSDDAPEDYFADVMIVIQIECDDGEPRVAIQILSPP